MFTKGQRVLVKSDIPFGEEVEVPGTDDRFFVPEELSHLVGKMVTITRVQPWRNLRDGNAVYYYRIKEDGGDFGWLESFFEPVNIEQVVLITLKDDRFIVINKNNLSSVDSIVDFNSLPEEVRNRCTIY